MLSDDTGIYIREYQSNSEWDIVSTSSKKPSTSHEAGVYMVLTIRRKPMYVIIAVIFPITMLSILNICVFLLPCESGERSGYAVTVFLAFAVFLTIISSTMPENSEHVAIFSVFLLVQTLSSTLITILALVMIRVVNKDDNVDPVPRCLAVVLLAVTCQCCQKKSTQVHAETPPDIKEENVTWDGRTDETTKTNLTWKETVVLLDKIFFLFFLAVFVLSISIYLATAASQ